MRICPFTLAWADTADGTNQAHYYAECGNKGICDRTTGECACFEGFEGSGCRRSVCPANCNGVGTCELMKDLARDWQNRKSGPGHKFKEMSCNTLGTSECHFQGLKTTNIVARSANSDHIHGILYQNWDAAKIQICRCDVGFDGPDCGLRMVPKGDDPLTIVQSIGMKQGITFTGDSDGEFVITYHDPYGGSWVTDAIKSEAGTEKDDKTVAKRAEDALKLLPQEVFFDVSVTATTDTSVKFCSRMKDGVQHLLAQPGHSPNWRGKVTTNQPNQCEAEYTNTGVWDPSDSTIDLTITFGTSMGLSGVQYLLEVDTTVRESGSSPVSAGISVGSGLVVSSSVAEINYNDNLTNLSELTDCGDRGLDNGEGECECFEGFKGGACELLELYI